MKGVRNMKDSHEGEYSLMVGLIPISPQTSSIVFSRKDAKNARIQNPVVRRRIFGALKAQEQRSPGHAPWDVKTDNRSTLKGLCNQAR